VLIPLDLLLYVLFLGFWLEGGPDRAAAPLPAAALATAACLLPAWAAAWAAARAACRRWRGPAPALAAWRGRLETAARLLTLAFSVLALEAGRLPAALAPGGGPAAVAWGLAPYLIAYGLVWTGLHAAFARLEALAGAAVPAGRLASLLRRSRYGLCFALLWLPLAAAAEGLGRWGHPGLAWPAAALLAWASPALLVRLWGCRPLGPGPLAEAVADLEARAGTRFSRLYEWPLGDGRALNAAAMGFAPPFRYLLLTPGLVRRLPPDELDAVVAHELGHARRHHQLAIALAGLIALAAVLGALAWLPAAPLAGRALAAGAAVAALVRWGLGWGLRRFERQADLHALKIAGDPEPLVSALERIAAAAGASRSAPSWHHYGVHERASFLRRAAADPSLAARHDRRADALRNAAFGLACLIAGWMAGRGALDALRPTEGEAGPARRPAAVRPEPGWPDGGARAHGRRLATLFPDKADPAGPDGGPPEPGPDGP